MLLENTARLTGPVTLLDHSKHPANETTSGNAQHGHQTGDTPTITVIACTENQDTMPCTSLLRQIEKSRTKSATPKNVSVSDVEASKEDRRRRGTKERATSHWNSSRNTHPHLVFKLMLPYKSVSSRKCASKVVAEYVRSNVSVEPEWKQTVVCRGGQQ